MATISTTTANDAQSHDSLTLLIGTTLAGRYVIHREVGKGTSGAVFVATHAERGQRVAIKILVDRHAERPTSVARFEQEARLASAIGHEHIVTILDAGRTPDGRPYIVMEFLEGESLDEVLAREGVQSEDRILRIARQVASALGAAHAKGIVHRDIKPANVFVMPRPEPDYVKVLDFGTSKLLTRAEGDTSASLTQAGVVVGTPMYMAPEQARDDDDVDARVDLYALGVIMYELASGQPPFTGRNEIEILTKVATDTPPPLHTLRPELSDEFVKIVARAMAADRTARYRDAEAMAQEIASLLAEPRVGGGDPRIVAPAIRVPPKPILRVVRWTIGITVLIAAVVAATVALMRGQISP